MIGTLVYIFEASVLVFVSHYYLYISNDWFWLQVGGLSLSLTLLILCLILPESPEYLMSMGLFENARESLRKIAKLNGAN